MWRCSLQFKVYRAFIWRVCVDCSWNVMAQNDAREGKWKGKCQMQWVASTLHTTSEHAVSNITTADAHTSPASSWLNWRLPADLYVLVRLDAKKKSGFSACAVTFQKQSTACRWLGVEVRQSAHVHCCLQTVGLCALGTSDPEVEGTIFFWKVKSPGLFTRWQRQRHILRDSHCHLLTTMEFQICKFITYPTSQTCQIYPCLCAWHLAKGKVEVWI